MAALPVRRKMSGKAAALASTFTLGSSSSKLKSLAMKSQCRSVSRSTIIPVAVAADKVGDYPPKLLSRSFVPREHDLLATLGDYLRNFFLGETRAFSLYPRKELRLIKYPELCSTSLKAILERESVLLNLLQAY